MESYCQKDYTDVAYGDGSIAENGCACCVMASLAKTTPERVAHTWGNRYWDNTLGTLPEAFDSSERDFDVPLKAVQKAGRLRPGDIYVLLADDEGGRHYEILRIASGEAEIHDPRTHDFDYCTPSIARQKIESSERAWLASGID